MDVAAGIDRKNIDREMREMKHRQTTLKKQRNRYYEKEMQKGNDM